MNDRGKKIAMVFLGCFGLWLNMALAQDIPGGAKVFPGGFNNLEYMYVYGPKGRATSGREDGLQVIFFRTPKNISEKVTIYIYDPGNGGQFDSRRTLFGRKMETRFTVYGGAGAYSAAASQSVVPTPDQPGIELVSKTFTDDYVDQWVELGSFPVNQGETIGKYSYFKVVAHALSGSKVNNFRTAVKPKSVDAFTYNLTVRLNETRGVEMAFAVEVPENTTNIIEYNFDIDKGGTPYLETPTARYELYPSASAKWISNEIELDVPTAATQNFRYEIVKGSQGYANCGFFFTDDSDRPLRIFFEGDLPTEPVVASAPPKAKPPKLPPKRAPIPVVTGDRNQCETSTDLISIYKHVPKEVSLGDSYVMKMVITSLADVADVKVEDILPDGASYVKSEPSAKQSGNQLTWTFERMNANESKEINVTLKANKEGELLSCATFAAIPYGCLTTSVGQPVLAIEKTGPEKATLNDEVTYTITVRNTGTAVAKNVVITDTVPNGLVHSTGNSSLTFDVGDLAPNESRQESVTFQATNRGKVCNPAVATSDNADRVSDQACTEIVEQKLEIVKTGPKEQYLGKVAKYTIKVSNPGDVTLTDVDLTDIAPSQTRIVKAKGGSTSGNRATWTVPQIKAGETLEFDIALTTDTLGNHCNEAAVRVAEGLTGESSACTVWKGYPALLLEVIDTVDPLQIDEETTYEIRVTNQGTAVDTDVGITVRFPAEITPVTTSGATKAFVEGQTVKFSVYPELAPKEVIEFAVQAKATQIGDARLKVELISGSLGGRPVNEEESTHVY